MRWLQLQRSRGLLAPCSARAAPQLGCWVGAAGLGATCGTAAGSLPRSCPSTAQPNGHCSAWRDEQAPGRIGRFACPRRRASRIYGTLQPLLLMLLLPSQRHDAPQKLCEGGSSPLREGTTAATGHSCCRRQHAGGPDRSDHGQAGLGAKRCSKCALIAPHAAIHARRLATLKCCRLAQRHGPAGRCHGGAPAAAEWGLLRAVRCLLRATPTMLL